MGMRSYGSKGPGYWAQDCQAASDYPDCILVVFVFQDKRYAPGEITKDDYERMKEDLNK